MSWRRASTSTRRGTSRWGGEFTVKVQGQAPGRATLVLFLDFQTCAHTPAVELKHREAPDLTVAVRGRFSKALPAEANRRGTDHVCGFLLAAGRRKVLARARTGFPVR
jgi:hypothetical protein